MSDVPVPFSVTPVGPVGRGTRERREGWGMASHALCEVRYATSADDVAAALKDAADRGVTVTPWGAGRSYGDAALNESAMVLDLSRMNQIIAWDAETGRVTVQPGVTLATLWRHILRDGWWPAVVSGTMTTTIGGLVAANAHGKNNGRHGPIGEHVVSFTMATTDGTLREVTADSDPDLFHAAIGGFGWLGVFTCITLQTHRVHSGRVEVGLTSEPTLSSMFRRFERAEDEESDYVVGWIDAFGRGTGLGRGQVHVARYLAPGEDPEARETLALDRQDLPPRMFGVLPKRWLWRLMRPVANRLGMRALNWGRYHWLRLRPAAATRLEEHARFNFLLDYVPDWKRMYGKNGLIQYQLFLPKDDAEEVFRRVLEMCQAAGLEPWLVVMKRHRQDAFWLSHALDGYSFACDFPVLPTRRGDLWRLTQRFNRVVTAAGGRFYFAKDSVLTGDAVERAFGLAVLGRFFALKERLDPQGTLQSSLFRRVFGARWRALAAADPVPEDVREEASEVVVAEPTEA